MMCGGKKSNAKGDIPVVNSVVPSVVPPIHPKAEFMYVEFDPTRKINSNLRPIIDQYFVQKSRFGIDILELRTPKKFK